MGAWGTGLYANDASSDVRGTYEDFLKEGLSNKEAYEKTMQKLHEYIGSDEEALLWYALADTQWKLGRLMPEVKKNALAWIEKGGGLDLWEESKSGGAGWKKTLEKLKTKLESPAPPEKVIKNPKEYVHNPWNVGDVYAYKFFSERSKAAGLFGKYILIQKIADALTIGEMCSCIQIYDKLFDTLPVLGDIQGVRLLPFASAHWEARKGSIVMDKPMNMGVRMMRYTKRDYSDKHYTFIGNDLNFEQVPISGSDRLWNDIENRLLLRSYFSWREYSYEIKDGKTRINFDADRMAASLETFGIGLYSHDCACHIRSVYNGLICKQLSAEEAVRETVKDFGKYAGAKDEALLWYVIADVQWNAGCLAPEIKEKALELIAKDGGQALWSEMRGGLEGWRKTLQGLKARLEAPFSSKTEIKKPSYALNPWKTGDVYAFRYYHYREEYKHINGKYFLLQKIGDAEYYGQVCSRVQIYDKIFDELPKLADIDGLKVMPWDLPDDFITGARDTVNLPLRLNMVMVQNSEYTYSGNKKWLKYIGNRTDFERMPLASPWLSNSFWDIQSCCESYLIWRNYEYDITKGKASVRKK